MKEILSNLPDEDKILMKKMLTAGHIEYKYARRLRIVLQRAEGKSAREITRDYSVGRSTVSTIVNRYNQDGLESLLHGRTRKPGKAPISRDLKNRICLPAMRKAKSTSGTRAKIL